MANFHKPIEFKLSEDCGIVFPEVNQGLILAGVKTMNEKKQTLTGQKGACVLHAITEVSGIEEDRVITVCKAHGFKSSGGGMNCTQYKPAMKELGIEFEEITGACGVWRWLGETGSPRLSLRRFINENKEGVFLVTTLGHAFAVRDGHLIDNLKYKTGRRIVQMAYRILNPTPTVGRRAKGERIPDNPILQVLHYGSSHRGWSTRATAWRNLAHTMVGDIGTGYVQFSDIPEYTKAMLSRDLRRGFVRVVDDTGEVLKAMAKITLKAKRGF